MPIKKKSNGWKWGNSKTFKSKKKAEEVQRAAYANGYKGSKKKHGTYE